MKSINVVIDDAITKVATDDSGEGTSFKKAIVEIEAQDVTSCQFFFFKGKSQGQIFGFPRAEPHLTPLLTTPFSLISYSL